MIFCKKNIPGFEYLDVSELTLTDLEKIKAADIEYF